MGGAQARRNFRLNHLPRQAWARATVDVGEDEDVEFEFVNENTFLYREKRSKSSKRSRSRHAAKPPPVQATSRSCGGSRATGSDSSRSPPLDSPFFEPFLTLEMVASEHVWRREVIGELACQKVQKVTELDLCCPDFSRRKCCRLDNNNWWLASLNHLKIPGTADPCRALQIFPALPDRAAVGWR